MGTLAGESPAVRRGRCILWHWQLAASGVWLRLILFHMKTPGGYRKLVKHWETPRRVRLLTFSCAGKRPLLTCDLRCRIVMDAMEAACLRHRWVLVAFVLMPDHVHLVAVPWDGASGASALLYALKRPSSFRIKKLLGQGAGLARELEVNERPGKVAFRFWQEGPGHDRNMRNDQAISDAIDYVHLNPVRRGLCSSADEWRWSSARQYMTRVPGEGVPRVVRWHLIANLEWEGPETWFGDRGGEVVPWDGEA